MALVAVVAVAVVGAACGSSTASRSTSPPGTDPVALTAAPSGEAQRGGGLVVGLTAETNDLSPHRGQWGLSGLAVANALYDPLAALDEAGDVRPYLAEDFATNEDFTRWDIRLRPGITFHDGTALDADVVAANLEAVIGSPLLGQAFALVSDVEASEPLVVTVHLDGPWSTFPAHLAGQAGYVVAEANLADATSTPIGTGPFTFNEWVRDAHLKLDRNDVYWQEGLPYLDALEFRPITDPLSRQQSIQSGTIDAGLWTSPYGAVLAAAEAGELQLYTDAGAETGEIFVTLNTAAPPFDDPVAREALDAVVDRTELIDAAFDGLYLPATGPLNPDSPFHTGDAAAPAPDLERARRLAQDYEARKGEPLRFTLLVTPVLEYLSAVQLVQAQAGEAGIVIDIETQLQSALIASVLSGNYQASGFFFFGNPHLDLEYPYLAGAPAGDGQLSLNFTRYDDPALRSAMDRARTSADRDEQAAAYAEVEAQLAATNRMVFLAHARTAFAFANGVHGPDAVTLPDGTPAMVSTAPSLARTWKAT